MKTIITRLARRTSDAVLLSAIISQRAFAEGQFGDIPDTGGGEDIHGALENVITKILTFLGIVAVIVIVVAGIRLIIGGADEQQREKARNAVLYAVIGLILVLLAGAIVRFVATNFATS